MNSIQAAAVVVLATILLSACGDDATTDELLACSWDADVASSVATRAASITSDAGVQTTRARPRTVTITRARSPVSVDGGSVYSCPGE